MKRLAALLMVLALPLAAQAELQPEIAERMSYMESVTPCFDAADTPEAARTCRGEASSTCMETEPDGYTTFGMTFCTLAEHAVWDDLLNREYRTTRARLRDMDAGEFDPQFAVRADRLLEAQRAWIAFRDAECLLAYAEFGAGTMGRINGVSCELFMTSDRAIELKFMMASQ